MRKYLAILILLLPVSFLSCKDSKTETKSVNDNNPEEPRIVNIINFVRLLEPRIPEFTEEVLYNTVVEQVRIMRQYKLRGTFLLQYDALMDPRYQQLMKSLPRDTFEIGGWLEIPQPLVENAGMKWRGRYPWDWHANVGFTTGYTPEEREKLADVYMSDFKKIFGYYPESVGCWFIDAHTLGYLCDKYKISSSCMCRDQIGTDGYTVWGGYWNQAYYPSRLNSYMPAQTEEKQIPVPVFRMLGSDPVRQYDKGVPPGEQGVMTLEPVYKPAGGDSTWVSWFFSQLVDGESLEFNYVQAGQENSFTWRRMEKGYRIQMPLIAKLRDENRLNVETLGESGKWFTEHYKTTPATSMTVSRDIDTGNLKTAWFDSRYYRANLLWENNHLRIRDIHLFDEDLPSFTTNGVLTTTYSEFFTLPFVDGYRWSTKDFVAGMRLKCNVGGKDVPVEGKDPVFTENEPGKLQVSWPLTSIPDTLVIKMDEKEITMELQGNENWYLELSAAESAELPFRDISEKRVDCVFEGLGYHVTSPAGRFIKTGNALKIVPQDGRISLGMSDRD